MADALGASPSPTVVVEAILEAGPGGRHERYVPRYYWSARRCCGSLAPDLIRRGASSDVVTTNTKSA